VLGWRSRVRPRPRLVFPSMFAPLNAAARACQHSGKGATSCGTRPGFIPECVRALERPEEGATALGSGRDPRANPAPLRQQTQPLEVLREAGAVGGGDPGHAGGGVV